MVFYIVFLALFFWSCSSSVVSKEESIFSAIPKGSFYVKSTKGKTYVKIVNPELKLEKVCDIGGNYPLGDVVFLTDNTFVVPYAKVKKLSEKEKEEYKKKREEYLKKSPEELAKEVVKREKGESDISYELRKRVSIWFFKIVKKDPSLFLNPPDEVATEVGVQVIEVDKEGCKVKKIVPVIKSQIPTLTNCSVLSGTNIIDKPYKVCKKWTGLETYIVSDEKNIYVYVNNYKLKHLPTFVIDKSSLSLTGKIDNVRIEDMLSNGMLKAFLLKKKRTALGSVKKYGNRYIFVASYKINFPYGKAILYNGRFLINLFFPKIYDLETGRSIVSKRLSAQELKGKLYISYIGFVKRLNETLSRVEDEFILCSIFHGDKSNYCYLANRLNNKYLMFLHDEGVSARNPDTGRVYGGGTSYKAKIWALNPYSKSKFVVLNKNFEYHNKFFRFFNISPSESLFVVINVPDKILVYKINYSK